MYKTLLEQVKRMRQAQRAVNFLKHVFNDNVSHMANIAVAEAEGDKDTIRKYLESIKELIDKWIEEL